MPAGLRSRQASGNHSVSVTSITSGAVSRSEATRISQRIDDELRRDYEQSKRRKASKPEIKVMLLGQAESGKSTLRKQFQLNYASRQLDRERPAWRPVVHSNILTAVCALLHALATHGDNGENNSGTDAEPRFSVGSGRPQTTDSAVDTERVDVLRARLETLGPLKDALARVIGGDRGGPIVAVAGVPCVRADWQALMADAATQPAEETVDTLGLGGSVLDFAARVLRASACDIAKLWAHPVVREMVDSRAVVLEECAERFLDDIQRVTEPDYVPTMDDVLAVRLRSLGVTTHEFDVHCMGSSYTWLLYDVGGARGQRLSWVPYFDDATAIIFLAPMSAFDQYLTEDPRVNRIDDSLQLWTAVCMNKLLAKAALILLLNKADLLRKKIESGLKIKRFITSYGERQNTFEAVSDYFRAHFVQIHRKKDEANRRLYVQFTSMLDVKDSQRIIFSVNDSIIREHMSATGLIQ